MPDEGIAFHVVDDGKNTVGENTHPALNLRTGMTVGVTIG